MSGTDNILENLNFISPARGTVSLFYKPEKEHYGIDIDYLTKLYLEYCIKQKIECVDAMEYLNDPNILNDNQNLWMKQFCVAWDRAQNKEDKKENEK